MIFTYNIKLIEYHVFINKNTFYVWYNDHYIHDFTRISKTHVYDLKHKVKRKLLPYYRLTCMYDDNEFVGFSYSQQSLTRQLKRGLRYIDKNIILKKVKQ